MTTVLLAIVVLLLVALIVVKKRGARSNKRPDESRIAEPRDDAKFHAVSLRLGLEPCTAAKRMAERRFLSNAAPRIPLPECDATKCECRFVHHADRRAGDDRRSPFISQFGAAVAVKAEKDKRESPDRREDKPPDQFKF